MPAKVIDRSHLECVVGNNCGPINIGEGSFGCCSKMIYCGILVAVKQFNELSSLSDVRREASILAKLSHPNIPVLLGICITKPYLLVMNFCSINNQCFTLKRMMYTTKISLAHQTWVQLLTELTEALSFIHSQSYIHRDLKSDNVVISYYNNKYVPVVIDYGKCVSTKEDIRCKVMTEEQQQTYRLKFPHIATEIVSGSRPTIFSDIYSLGLILNMVHKKVLEQCIPYMKGLVSECTHVQPSQRPSLIAVVECLESYTCKCQAVTSL